MDRSAVIVNRCDLPSTLELLCDPFPKLDTFVQILFRKDV